MIESLKSWLTHNVLDNTLSPIGAVIVSLVSAAGNTAYWLHDNINFIAAVSGIVISWLVYRGSQEKRELEIKLMKKKLGEE